MPPPEGEHRNQGVSNPGRSATDKRLQEWYYDPSFTGIGRPQVNTQTRVLEKDGRFIFTYNEDIASRIPAYRMQGEGLTPTTLVMDAFERADYRQFATEWETQNSPICVYANRYQPVLDEGDQVISYLRVEWTSGVAHALLFSIEGQQLSDQTIAEKPLQEDLIGNELVAAIVTLGGSLLVRSLARVAISSSSRFLGAAIAETAIDAARGVTAQAFRLALLALRCIRGRALVAIFKLRGLKVIVNIGGEAAPHEIRQGAQIALNPFVKGVRAIKRTVPNLIREFGEEIGNLFEKESVDRIISNRLPTSVDTGRIAEGAGKVLKPGGELKMNFLSNDPEFMNTFRQQLLNNKFRSATVELAPPFPGAKPIPNGTITAIR
jgi:hypothetical protein